MGTEAPWQKNAPSQIVLDSIFAALAAIWITFAIADNEIPTVLRLFEVGCSLFSFFLFAISAEGATNSCEEDDCLKYVYYLLWYNVGVVLIAAAIAILVFSHFDAHFLRKAGSILWYAPPFLLENVIRTIYGLLFVVLLWRWLSDSVFVLFASRADFDEYLAELRGDQPANLNRHWLMRIVFCHRI